MGHGEPTVAADSADESIAEAVDRQEAWDFTGARDILERLLATPDGGEGLTGLTARRMLAEVLRELGDLPTALELAEPALAESQRRYGWTHPATVRTMAVLASLHHDLGDFERADRLYHRVLDGGVREDGPTGRAVRLARVNLALLHRDRGDRGLALTLLTAAYAVHRREYGADDLDTVRIGAELAALHLDDGDLAAARQLLTSAYAAARVRLGELHPMTRAVERDLIAVEPPVAGQQSVAGQQPIAGQQPMAGQETVAGQQPMAGQETVVGRQSMGGQQPVAGQRPAAVGAGPERWLPPVRVRVMALAAAAVLAVVLVVALAFGPDGPAGSKRAPVVRPDGTAVAALNSAAPATPRSGEPGSLLVRLRDDRTELHLTWIGTGGGAPIIVALARDGGPAAVVATLPAGTAEYVVRGVDPAAEYCVVVGAAGEARPVAPATSVCTRRR